jgi:hypothetical protein
MRPAAGKLADEAVLVTTRRATRATIVPSAAMRIATASRGT